MSFLIESVFKNQFCSDGVIQIYSTNPRVDDAVLDVMVRCWNFVFSVIDCRFKCFRVKGIFYTLM